jgi:Fe-S-cluster containining protein
MSRLLGIGTTEFLARYSDNGGTTLRADAAGRCVFVSDRGGCQVHPARPLVCRLYPLGRAVDGAGKERFAVFPKQEGCEAEFGTEGTVAGFLGSQGVAPYFEWSDRYGRLYHRMMALLERLGIEGKIEVGAGGEEGGTEEAGGAVGDATGTDPEGTGIPSDQAADASPLSSWQDVDASLADYCAAKGLDVPEGIEAAIELHLKAIEEWLDELEETNDELS